MQTEASSEYKRLKSDLNTTLLQARLGTMVHQSYQSEMEFFELVKNGDIDELSKRNFQSMAEGQGVLSTDPAVNLRTHIIIATALIARYCVENGLSREEAYSLSDTFIRKLNNMNDIADMKDLHKKIVFAYATRMQQLTKQLGASIYVRKSIDYITLHLNSHLLIEDISAFAGVSSKYLCTLFKKETGVTIADYIESKRMEEACTMLLYSDFTYAEIADTLSYSSQSYFTKVFKSHYGVTPMQYRKNNSH